MDIILLERIENLGQMGDVVSVKPGYARNFLFPRKKALRANANNLRRFETQRKELEAGNLKRKTEAEDIAKRMNGLQLVIIRNAGEAGQLYGSVNARDVSDSVTENGYRVSRNQIVIDRPIKVLGIFDIRIRLHPEVSSFVTVNVARSADEAKIQKDLGHAVIAGDDEMQENEEDSQQAAVLATAEIFEPEAQAKAAAQLGDETATSGDTKLSADGPIKKINNVDKVKVDQITVDNESDSPEKSL